MPLNKQPKWWIIQGLILIPVLLVLMISQVVLACGICYDDDRSAVYSYEAEEKIRSSGGQLEFVVLKVKGNLSRALIDNLGNWLSSQKGIDQLTIKISAHQNSIGFVLRTSQRVEALVFKLSRSFPSLHFTIRDYD